MVTLKQIKIKRQGLGYQVYRGSSASGYHQNLKAAKVQAGAIRRVEIKHALRKLGIKKMPRSLTKQIKGSYGNY